MGKRFVKELKIEGVTIQVYGYGKDKEIAYEIPNTISGNLLEPFKMKHREKIERFTGVKIKPIQPNDIERRGRQMYIKKGVREHPPKSNLKIKL